MDFKPQNLTPLRKNSEINHSTKCQSLRTTKFEAKRAFLKEDSQEKLLHDNRCN